ncbi:hypothetical protein KR054_008103 [Drosophila jambulina]|nr:hypothetical protein KR054_008103 [Drosophila jambulina]
MYAVRETKTSMLRASRGPVPHALEHVAAFGGTPRPRLEGGQAPRSCPEPHARIGHCSQSHPEILPVSLDLVVTASRTNSHCMLSEQDLGQSPVLESHFDSELTIGELQNKLLQSEELASEQALQLSEILSAQKAKNASYNEMLPNLEKASTKAHQASLKAEGALITIIELKYKLTSAKAIKEGQAEAESELQEQLRSDQQLLVLQDERIQELEEDLESAGETIANLQEQLKETEVLMKMHAEAESRLRQELARMQQELEHNRKEHSETIEKLQQEIKELQQSAQAEAQLRQDVSNLKEQLQSNQDLLNKFQDVHKGQDLEEQAKKDILLRKVTQELDARDGQYKFVCETLSKEQRKKLCQEHNLKLLQEQVERFSSMRAELEHRNAALENEIVRLKHEVRKYAEIIVGNEGEPFYEVRPLDVTSNSDEKSQDADCTNSSF